MSLAAEFNSGAVNLIKALGASGVYTQSSTAQTLNIYIDNDLEIIDPESGAATYVTAALIAKTDLNVAPQPADTILQDSRTWTVTRVLEDDGFIYTLEVI